MEADLGEEGLDSDKRLDDLAKHSLKSYRRMGGNCLLYTSDAADE